MEAAKTGDIRNEFLPDPLIPEEIWERGSLGSPVLALRGGHPEMLKLMADLCEERFRKGWRDLREGIAVFMAPTMRHEIGSKDVEDLVRALCSALSLPVVSLSATTVRGARDGDERRGDPDESFFIGAKAERYLATKRRESVAPANEAFSGTPADLAVEVEHTHYDVSKRTIYREGGVSELWEMGTARSGRAPAIVDLRAPDGPRAVVASRVVPGIHVDGLDEALDVLREIGGLVDFVEAKTLGEPVAKRLLAAAGRAPSLN